MKTFKKILFIILAILPILLILINVVVACATLNHSQYTFSEYVEIWYSTCTLNHIDVSDDIPGVYVYECTSDLSLLERSILNVCATPAQGIENRYVTFSPFIGEASILLNNIGVSTNVLVVFIPYIFWYWFIILLINALWEILTFVPRKCSEIFQ